MESVPFLVAGLGNPGSDYEDTPHNVGFALIDALSSRLGVSGFKSKFEGELGDATYESSRLYLLKPQTYMNLSGKSVAKAVRFFKVEPKTHLLVVVDDLDLPPGQLRLRKAGGTGGHNGLKSIQECLGTKDFPRLRIGIGRAKGADPSRHVLSKIKKSDKPLYEEALLKAVEGIERWVKEGIDKTMNWVNARSEENGT